MRTIFDWLSLVLFAALAILFLRRSVEGESVRSMWKYLPPAIACAVGNYVGNNGQALLAVLFFGFAVAFGLFVLKPMPWDK